jgi:hypothetical protein
MSLPISDGLVTPKATGRIKRIAWSSVGIELSMAFRTGPSVPVFSITDPLYTSCWHARPLGQLGEKAGEMSAAQTSL